VTFMCSGFAINGIKSFLQSSGILEFSLGRSANRARDWLVISVFTVFGLFMIFLIWLSAD
jgi:hypothetical protein